MEKFVRPLVVGIVSLVVTAWFVMVILGASGLNHLGGVSWGFLKTLALAVVVRSLTTNPDEL